jgi:hypothetical protein
MVLWPIHFISSTAFTLFSLEPVPETSFLSALLYLYTAHSPSFLPTSGPIHPKTANMHHKTIIAMIAGLSTTIQAKESRTFAVNHFYGKGALVTGRMDPITNPGVAASHVHTIQGGSNFNLTMTDDALPSSNCTSSRVDADKSNYWTPSLYFQASNGSFLSVPMFYMNVYYFFEATDDEIKPFPVGLRMLSGDKDLRTPPAGGASNVLDTNEGVIQPVQWTCPRKSYNPPSYPASSDGLHGVGIQDPNNAGQGAGFPHVNCDGYASPLRADIHFPSCYNPAAGLRDYKNNMAWPSSKGTTGGKANCPEGWVHVPHIFYEVYWNTPLFEDLWTPGMGEQPFILSNGDRTGYSLHGDFVSFISVHMRGCGLTCKCLDCRLG